MIHVAVGVVCNTQNQFLVALRRPSQHLAGLWEFPGGKLEPSESPIDGLKRELFEEVNLKISNPKPLCQITHHYPNKSVLLDIFVIKDFVGDAMGREGQEIQWVDFDKLSQLDLPEANREILERLSLFKLRY